MGFLAGVDCEGGGLGGRFEGIWGRKEGVLIGIPSESMVKVMMFLASCRPN